MQTGNETTVLGNIPHSDSRFNDGSLVLDPVSGALLVVFNGACLEASAVALQHTCLMVISSTLLQTESMEN